MVGSNIQKATAGFMTFALSLVGMAIFTFWSLLPEPALNSVGFSYYPNRYWAVAAPAIATVLLAAFLFSNFTAYMRNTKPLDDMFLVTDEQAKEAMLDSNPLGNMSASVQPLGDIPVAMSSLVLHQPWPGGGDRL